MNNLDLFFITDGDEYVNLRSVRSGIFLQGWQPAIKEPKGGGTFQESPMSDSRVLVARPFGNAVEQLGLMIGSGGQDATIYDTRRIRRLLQKAVNYSLTEWQTEPVWIMARARRETNIRYATILDYRAPGENNPFAETFDSDEPLITNFPLLLERGDWLSNPPGQAECLPVSTSIEIGTQVSYSPIADSDDAYVNTSFIFGGPYMEVGNKLSASLRAGIRFQGVAIPQAATIVTALLRLTYLTDNESSILNLRIRGEDADDAAAFSTFANFTGRAETTAFTDWLNLAKSGIGDRVVTPDFASVIQEIVDRAGWASGNDLVIFLDDNASSIDANRRFTTFENTSYLVPVLEVVYNDGLVNDSTGQTATCENSNYVSNRRSGVLTHIFYYDDSAATFSSNLLASALPITLYPSPPGVDDILYYISETSNPLSAPIGGVVHDLSVAFADVTGAVTEYWDGAAWQTLPTAYPPDYFNRPFLSTGIQSIHARQPVDLATVTINSVTGWAIRVRITSVGAAPVAPVQQNRYPYALGWNEITLAGSDLGGDLPPLINLLLYSRADDTGNLTPVPIAVQRVVIGARSVARGELFTSIINLGDLQNPDGVITSVGANTTFGADPQSPTGRVAIFNPVAAATIQQRVLANFDSPISQHYKGVFKPFLRVKQVGGIAGEMAVRLRVGLYSGSNIVYTSETVYTTTTDELELFEFRELTLPPNLDIIKTSESIAGIVFSIEALSASGTPNLHFIDLWLMPTDEFGLDTYDTIQSGDSIFGNPDGANRLLEIDSAIRLKRPYSSTLLLEQGPIPLLNYAINANGPFTLQPNGDQKLHFLFARINANNGWDSYPENAVSVQMHIQKRYFSMRGNS